MRLLTPIQAYELEDISMNSMGISGYKLMGNAGRCIADLAMKMISDNNVPLIVIVCGKGNNGGDGFATALELLNYNVQVQIYVTCNRGEIKDDALIFFLECESHKFPIIFGDTIPINLKPDLIIDGIIGTGFKGNLRQNLLPWIEWINSSESPVLSIDISSGLSGNSGEVLPIAVNADKTLTFGAPKFGTIFRKGPLYSGEVITENIGFPNLDEIDFSGIEWSMFDESLASVMLKKPGIDSNKYSNGKVLIIAGSKGLTGAAILTSYGALRSGVGLTITTSPSSLNDIYERSIIEGITLPLADNGSGHLLIDHYDQIMEKVEWADAVVLGPGIGRAQTTQELVIKLVESISKPLILDADGLFPFAGNYNKLRNRKYPLIITPHLGELSKLLGIESSELISNFPNIMKQFMSDFNHIAHIKQVPSCTFQKEISMINSTGNPGLATGGSGDVLSGILGSLVAQGFDLFTATTLSAYIHGKASDNLIKEKGFRGQIASDLLLQIPKVISHFEQS